MADKCLHFTKVIKSTGVMKGLYPDNDLNSENVKDRDSKIAFLQKAVDYVCAATGKQLSVKPAKVVAGHEPEKTNEFLQALAQAIGSKVDNNDVLDSMNNKDKSGKKEEKEEKSRDREKSSDRRKRDEKSRDREEKEDRHKERSKDRSKDRDERHKDRDDRHKDREDRHKEKEDRHKDRDREREREGRHKSGRTRHMTDDEEMIEGESGCHSTPDDIDSDVLLSEGEIDTSGMAGNATYAVLHPSQMFEEEDSPPSPQTFRPIPRQVSTYLEMKKPDKKNVGEFDMESGDTDSNQYRSGRADRPKAARPRRGRPQTPTQGTSYEEPTDEPSTPFVSEDDSIPDKAKGDQIENDIHLDELVKRKSKKKSKKKAKDDAKDQIRSDTAKEKIKSGKYPKTSTPNDSPSSPKREAKQLNVKVIDKTKQATHKSSDADHAKQSGNQSREKDKVSPMKGSKVDRKQKEAVVNVKKGGRKSNQTEQNMKKMVVAKKRSTKDKEDIKNNVDPHTVESKPEKSRKDVYSENRRRSRDENKLNKDDDELIDQPRNGKKIKEKYRNDDYAHEKIKKSKRKDDGQLEDHDFDPKQDMNEEDVYYKKKQAFGGGSDKRKRSSFTSMLENKQQRREEDGKENDAPKETMVNGDHKSNDAPQRMQRPSSAKGSRRRMEGGNLSSDEDVPAQRPEPALGDDDAHSQPAGRLARPSSARPAPPKRKEDTVNNEPAMRLGSGKPQNLILDDGKDSDEDETFVVEDAQGQQDEPEQPPAPLVEDDDEDHGGLVKKIMESKKEYEQPRETKIERPTISDAQRRKQREAVQREIDKLRGSIQTLTRSANPLGKIMDYVQEDLDSMQKELEKWKEENKEHGLALKREKAITERAVEPLRVQLSEVDQAIKDQLDLIGAVKSNIIRNDQKIEKMLRTIAKS